MIETKSVKLDVLLKIGYQPRLEWEEAGRQSSEWLPLPSLGLLSATPLTFGKKLVHFCKPVETGLISSEW